MKRLTQWISRIADCELGQDMVEYAMIILVISVPLVLVGTALTPAFALWAQTVAETVSAGGS